MDPSGAVCVLLKIQFSMFWIGWMSPNPWEPPVQRLIYPISMLSYLLTALPCQMTNRQGFPGHNLKLVGMNIECK